MPQKYVEQFAVITGASSGIGFELARQFVAQGFDILIAAEDEGIFGAAKQLKTDRMVIPVQVDLAKQGGVAQLWDEIKAVGRPIDAIAINAGVGVGGAFADNSLSDELNMIALNVTSSTILAKYAVQDMVPHRKGRILITASVVSVIPASFQTVYGATKAFLLSLAEGIRNELKDSGVSVTALMPGATETNFFHRAGLDDTAVGVSKKDNPADVARDGFEALMDGKDHVVSHSAKNVLMEWASEILPETVKAEMHRKQAEPGSAKKH